MANDNMVAEMTRLNQVEFTYPCRPAGERQGVSAMTISKRLKELVKLGVIEQISRGRVRGLDGEGWAPASIYKFLVTSEPPTVVSQPVPVGPKKKRPHCKLPLAVMKKLDEVTSLTYQTVLDQGGDVTHWKRWLHHLDSHRLGSQGDRYRWVVAKNDPQGSVAVDAHQRRQELKAYEFLHGADPGAADRRRMVAAMNDHGIPSTVTVSRVWVPGNYDYDGSYELVAAYRFTSSCPVATKTLAALREEFDGTDQMRAEAAIRLMEVYGVHVIRDML